MSRRARTSASSESRFATARTTSCRCSTTAASAGSARSTATSARSRCSATTSASARSGSSTSPSLPCVRRWRSGPDGWHADRAVALRELARKWAAPAAIVLVAAFLVWAFAATVLAVTRSMGLPLDDSYIYLTYAKQFGRAQPFTYFPGGGYSAGSTSLLWPMLLAPFWTLGARGHALVWVSYGICSALYAADALGVWRFVRGAAGEAAGLFAAGFVLCIAPFAFCSLSGMEVAFAAALIVAMLLLLQRGFYWRLLAEKAAASLSRPEAMLIVLAVCAWCAASHAVHTA